MRRNVYSMLWLAYKDDNDNCNQTNAYEKKSEGNSHIANHYIQNFFSKCERKSPQRTSVHRRPFLEDIGNSLSIDWVLIIKLLPQISSFRSSSSINGRRVRVCVRVQVNEWAVNGYRVRVRVKVPIGCHIYRVKSFRSSSSSGMGTLLI